MILKVRKYASKVWTKKDNIAKKLNSPYYIKINKIKYPNFKSELNYPININYNLNFKYYPEKYNKYKIENEDRIHFESLNGNEILYNMINFQYFSGKEKSESFLFLSLKEKPKNVDWNNHEIINSCLNNLVKTLDSLKPVEVAILIDCFSRMDLKDERIWEKFIKITENKYMNMKYKYYARLFIPIFNHKLTSNEFKEQLISLIPVHIRKISPINVANIFEVLVNNNKLSSYLFEEHFFMLFWKRPKWFTIESATKINHNLQKFGYLEDKEFWLEDWLPSLDETLSLKEENEQVILDYIESLKLLLNDKKFKFNISNYIEKAEERLDFVSTKLKWIKNNTFIEIVKSDLEYYKSQELKKLKNNI